MSAAVGFCLYLYFIISSVKSARILAVVPTPSISHQIVFRPLLQELVRRGHEVTVVTTDPAFPKGQAPVNLTEIDIHDLSYKIWSEVRQKITGKKDDNVYMQLDAIMQTMGTVFEGLVHTEEFQNIIHKRKGHFDLLILEAYFKPILVLAHFYKVPVIQMSSLGAMGRNYETFGVPTHPLLYPTFLSPRIYNLSYYEKLQQLYGHWRMETLLDKYENKYDKLLQKLFALDVQYIRNLYNYVDMLFLNVHPIWTDNQPVPPNVVYIGGIHNHQSKELPKDLESLLNGSRYGVVYFSLGTNVVPSALPPEKIQMMINVFSQLPYDVIWKWDLDTMPNKPDNIKIFKWLPQSDLLKHPKIKVFITQGGLQSTDEAIDARVPLIGIPMLGDQWFNTEKYAHHQIGVKLNLGLLTEKEFKEAIESVITDKRYRENINKLRSIMRDELQSPLQRAVWWTEYVLRHGGAQHLRAAGANVTWTEYLELELVAAVVTVLLTITVLLVLSLNSLRKLLNSKFKIKVL